MRWAMLPEKLEAMLEVLEIRAYHARPFTREEIEERLAENPPDPARVHQAANLQVTGKKSGGLVAILPLTGIIAPKASMVNGPSLPQGTSCEAFQQAFDAAIADDSVSHVVIDVDSPGGSVTGVPELAARMFAARGKKPITAVANSMAASAAYWLASAADELVVAPSGEVGSIGVFCVHEDDSGMYEQMGIKHTIIRAGDRKVEANPYEPLSEDARASIQADIDEFYSMFLKAVAKNRNCSIATVESDFGQGRMMLAKAAVAAGAADRIATLEQVLAKLGVSMSAYSNARRAELIDNKVNGEDIELDMAATAAATTRQAEAPALTAGAGGAALLVESNADTQPAPTGQENTVPDTATASPGGAATNASELVAAERKRVQEIRKLCRDHRVDDANFADELVDSGISVDVAARRILDLKREQASQAPHISVGVERATEKPFASLGEQLIAVMRASRSDNRVMDPRLQRLAAISGMSEGIPSDGGFAVQTDFAQEIFQRAYQTGQVLSRVRRVPSERIPLGRCPGLLGERGRRRHSQEAEDAPDGAHPAEAHWSLVRDG